MKGNPLNTNNLFQLEIAGLGIRLIG